MDSEVVPAAKSWRDSRNITLEVEADEINAAVIALERIDGLFETKGTANLVHSCLEILTIEESNRRKAIGDK